MKQLMGWLAQAFTLRTAETVEDATRLHGELKQLGPAPRVFKFYPKCKVGACGSPLASYANAQSIAGCTNELGLIDLALSRVELLLSL